MREKQPPLLVIYKKYEVSFDPSEPEAYRRDVPTAAVCIVDGRHFGYRSGSDGADRPGLHEVVAEHVRRRDTLAAGVRTSVIND
jgi:hypothetical protein